MHGGCGPCRHRSTCLLQRRRPGNHGAARFEDEVVPQCPVLPATLEQFTLNKQCGGRAEIFNDEFADNGAAFALIDLDLCVDAHRHAGQLWFTRPDGKHC